MKKLLLILICLFVSFEVRSEETDFNDLIERDGLYYKKFTDVPFTGKVFQNEINERTKKITEIHKGEIKKGKKKGKWLSFSPEGSLTNKSFYKNGLLHGKSTNFYDEGVYSEENYKDGKLHGKSVSINKNYKTRTEKNYKNGILKNWVEYHDEKIQYRGEFDNNGRQKLSMDFDDNKLYWKVEYNYKTNIKVNYGYDQNGKLYEKKEIYLEEWEKFPYESDEYYEGQRKSFREEMKIYKEKNNKTKKNEIQNPK